MTLALFIEFNDTGMIFSNHSDSLFIQKANTLNPMGFLTKQFTSRTLLFASLLPSLSSAAPPEEYYQSTSGLLGDDLRTALHDIINDHTVIPYSRTDEVMRVIDQDSENPENIDLIYSSFSMSNTALGASGSSVWNREHLWPRSYGIESSGPDNSDLHNLFPCNASVNSSRGNKFFDEIDSGSPNSISPENTADGDSWEPSDEDKGTVARAALYMSIRYDGSDGETSNLTLSDTPDSSTFKMGNLTTLLDWNRRFPPTPKEKSRNDSIFSGVQTTAGFLKQGNRNPFIDLPEIADALFIPDGQLTWFKWKWQSFTPEELEDPLIAGPLSDPDGDGFVNLIEFATNSNPTQAGSIPFYSVEADQTSVTFSFRKVSELELSGYRLNWEMSPDFKNNSWTTDPSYLQSGIDDGVTSLESVEIPLGSERLFLRLRVESIWP